MYTYITQWLTYFNMKDRITNGFPFLSDSKYWELTQTKQTLPIRLCLGSTWQEVSRDQRNEVQSLLLLPGLQSINETHSRERLWSTFYIHWVDGLEFIHYLRDFNGGHTACYTEQYTWHCLLSQVSAGVSVCEGKILFKIANPLFL